MPACAATTAFLVQGERRLSYGEFACQVWGTAAALRDEHGLRRGDRVSILSYNSPDWLIALFAATSLGGIGVGLNGWWTTEEIEYGLRDSGTRFLVVDDRLFPRVAPLLGKLPDLERVFYIGEPSARGRRADRGDPAQRRRGPLRADRRGRSLRDPLHLGHHRPLEGLHHHASGHHHAGARHRVRERGGPAHRRRHAAAQRWPSGDGAAHLAPLPRGRAPLDLLHLDDGRREGRLQLGQVRRGRGDAPDRARARDALERDPDHAPPRGALRARAQLRPLEPARHLVWGRADGAGDDREGARGAAGRAELRQRLRPDRDPRRRDAERRQGPARQEDLGGPPVPLPRHEDS